MSQARELTCAEAGLTIDQQIRIALETAAANGGNASIDQIYQAIETWLNGARLSEQGRASLRHRAGGALGPDVVRSGAPGACAPNAPAAGTSPQLRPGGP